MIRLTTISAIAGVILLITACDHESELSTLVREDGSLRKTIELKEAEQKLARKNFYGISPDNGWEYEQVRPEENSKKYNLRFTREFSSAGEFNEIMDQESDSLFRIRVDLNEEFRWFFTYFHFKETFRAADRFRYVDQQDFFTPEDYAFIDRLPAAGESVSKADSLFAEKLNEKIMDVYAMEGIFEAQLNFLMQKIDDYQLAPAWKDTLIVHRQDLYKLLTGENGDDLNEDIFIEFADSLGIPYPHPQIDRAYERELEQQEARLNFMSWVTDGTFTNHIEVPWKIVESNADITEGNRLTWQPPTTRLLLRDFTMSVTARRMNYWAVVTTAIVLLAGGVYFFRK